MTFRKIAKLLYCYIARHRKSNLTIQQYNNCKPQEGFTLIELMVVLSVTAVLGTLGIAGFTNYNQIQVLQSASNNLATTLNIAKSRALSQVKDSTLCGASDVLGGYKVVTNNDCKTYDLKVVCGGADHKVGNTKTLPGDVMFTTNTQKSFLFPVLTGGSIGDAAVAVSGYGRAECIAVSSTGVVSTHQQPCPPSSCTLAPTPTPTPTPTPGPGCVGGTAQDFGITSAGKKVHGCGGGGATPYVSAGSQCASGWHIGDVVLDTGLRTVLESTLGDTPFIVRWIRLNGDPGSATGQSLGGIICWGTPSASCTIPIGAMARPCHATIGMSSLKTIDLNGVDVLNTGCSGDGLSNGPAICVEGGSPPPPPPSGCADNTTDQDFGTTTVNKRVNGCNGAVAYASAGSLCAAGWQVGDVILDTGLASILSGTASNNPISPRWIYASGDPGPLVGTDPAFCWGTQAPCTIPQFEPAYRPAHFSAGNKIYISGALTLNNYGDIADKAAPAGAICVQN